MMASTSRRPVWLAVAIAVAVTAAAGCTTGAGSKGRPAQGAPVDAARTNGLENRTNGLENRSAAQVQKEVGAALKTAKSVHVTVTVSNSGHLPQLDLRIQGRSSTGAMGLGGVQFQVTSIGGATYIRGDQRVWEAFGVPAAVQQRLAGRWVKVRQQQFASLEAFSLDSLAAGLTRNDSRLVPKVHQATLDGRKVLVLRRRDGSRTYVANTGPAYPLRTDIRVLRLASYPQDHNCDLHQDAPLETVANRSAPMACRPSWARSGCRSGPVAAALSLWSSVTRDYSGWPGPCPAGYHADRPCRGGGLILVMHRLVDWIWGPGSTVLNT